MGTLVLLNAGAGTILRSGTGTGADAVRRVFEDHGVDADVRSVPGGEIAGQLRGFADSLSSRGKRPFDSLVVGGGDGTISSAAAVLAGTGVPLGILPLGTMNHFAKDLGLPLDLEGAVATIAAGRTRIVDLGEVNGRVFVNNSSIGAYPFLVARRTEEQRRLGLGKAAATVPAVIRTWISTSWHSLTIRAAGDRMDRRTPCVFVGNNLYDLAAMGARKDIDRGELCVYVVKRQTRLGLLALPVMVALDRTDPERDVERLVGPSFDITARVDQIRVAVDGEIARMTMPLRYRSRPGALTVFASIDSKA
jgi:diacylglycerol kinase family enzyme